MRKRTGQTTQTIQHAAAPEKPIQIANLLTVKEVAGILRVSPVQVYSLIKGAGLPSLKIKGARRFQPGKLQAWIEQHHE